MLTLLMALSTANQLMSLGQLKADLKPLKEWWPDGPAPYLLGGFLGVPVGLAILHSLPTSSLMLLFGGFLVIYAVYSMLKPDSLHVEIKGGPASSGVGGFMGGVAGLFVAMSSTVDYNMGFTPALLAFTAAVLGGIGNIRGAMVGGVVLGIIMYVPIYWIHQPFYEPVIGFTILVLVLMVRPTGLFGESLGRSA